MPRLCSNMITSALWENDEPVTELGIEVPEWIDQKITPYDVAAICQGRCASGAYMPAVTYHKANETMAQYGDDVLESIESAFGELPEIPVGESWGGIACFYLSFAVEIWAACVWENVDNAMREEI